MSIVIDPRMNTRLTEAQINHLVNGNPPKIAEDGMVYTGAVRLSFPKLAKPETMKNAGPGAVPKYQATGLFVHKNIGVIMQALSATVRQHYPNISDPKVLLDPFNKNSAVKDQALKVSVNDGGRDAINKTLAGYVPGLPFVSGKSEKAVPCFHFVQGRLVAVLPEELDKVLYGGCWASIKFKIIKSGNAGNPGVFFGLQGLTKLADDIQFGGAGGNARAEDFEGAVAIEDPNANSGVVPGSTVEGNDWGDDSAPAAGNDWG